mgnify:CR=1 FL=1
MFGAGLLLAVGLGAMLYNIQMAVSNFEFALEYLSIVFAVIVPILTMRVIAEERRQKTDQLLYSLPVTAYGSILAFFLMGAALIALGVFISSLTDNQGFAAGIGIAVILLNYFSVSLSEYVSATAFGSIAALCVIILALGAIIKHLTKSEPLAYTVCFVLIAAVAVTNYVNGGVFQGLLPGIMTKLSLFDRFTGFVNGVFDLTSVVYYASVIAFFLFLSVQSLEKRRYN